MAATARQERELKTKYEKQLKNAANMTPLECLRAHALSHGVRGIKTLGSIFRRLDKNKDGLMEFEEFQLGLHQGDIYVDKEIERECFDEMDLDKTGKLSFDEFLIALRPPMSNHRKELINKAFNKFDRNGDGVVNIDDLKGLYSAKKHPKYISGEMTEDEVFKEWLNSFGIDNKSGEITKEDFFNYYVGVSASIDSDAYFDLMMRQAWKL